MKRLIYAVEAGFLAWILLDFSCLLRGHDSPSESCCVLVNSLLCVLVCACYYVGVCAYTLSSRLLPFGWLLCQGSGALWQTRGLLVEFVFFFWYCNTFLLFYCLIFAVLSSLLCVIVWSYSSVLHPDTMYCLISWLGSLLWVSSCFEVGLFLLFCWYLPRIANF